MKTMEDPHSYLLFDSIHYVMKAEERLKKAGIVIDLVPVPKEISSDCGMCITFRSQDLGKISSLTSEQGFPGTIRVYQRTGKDQYRQLEVFQPGETI